MSIYYNSIDGHRPTGTLEARDSVSTYAIRRRGLQAEIQEIVKRYIIDHQFKPGDALPGEGELAKQMGISRPSLREAMKVLQTIGVIETRHGSGTYVGSFSLNPFAEGMAFQILIAAQHSETAPPELLDLVDLREAMETSQMRKVIGQHTDEQIANMRTIAREMAMGKHRSAAFTQRDLALHQLFYQPLQSRVFTEFIRMFWRISNLTLQAYAESSRDSVLEEHDRIIDAIAARDTEAAVEAVRDHIDSLRDSVVTTYDPSLLRLDTFQGNDAEEPAS